MLALNSALILDGIWQLSCPSRNLSKIPITIPGDVHSALLNASLIPDPFYSVNERLIQWVADVEWTIERSFEVSGLSQLSAYILVLESVDAFSTVYINDQEAFETNSAFKFFRVNIKDFLKEGSNTIKIIFHISKKKASDRYFSALPTSYPYNDGNNKVPFMNYIRMPQFHSGWDWGPCIITSGILHSVQLLPIEKNDYDLIEVSSEQIVDENDDITLKVDIDYECFETVQNVPLSITFSSITKEINLPKHSTGKYRYTVSFPTSNIQRWTTHEFGRQPLYDLTVTLNHRIIKKRIGIRKIVIDTHEDDYGTTFQFILNNKVVTARGADFIPMDSLPARMTYERTYELLLDMRDSNMNIIRIWGGGYYPDFLFDICDDLGILVWQDLMFGCAQYPNFDYFHQEVQEELESQITRMKHHASLALYCGDNEDFEAINWFSFTPEHKKWLKNEYKTFNLFLKGLIEKYDPSRRFWPSSPSDGTFNYPEQGAWSKQTMGDMHYWEVWHGGQPFESFYTIKPRFCSEFGYQSYSSLPTVKTYLPNDQYNIYSDAFDNHQKNAAGNQLIKNMFANYFNEPKTFVHQLYLSQVQQAVAIRMGCEYFRTLKPYTRGMIYWQINDCWPVTSWSSIEYGGRWKQLQYHAKRFFDPLMPTFYENKNYSEYINNKHTTITDNTTLSLYVINDKLTSATVTATITWMDFDGNVLKEWKVNRHVSKADTADIIWQIKSTEFDDKRNLGFFRCVLTETSTGNIKTNFFFATEYKNCDLKVAHIDASIKKNRRNGGTIITLKTDNPAFFVHLESEKVRKFSDSSMLLVPGEEYVVTCDETITLQDLTIYQLAEVGK